MLVVFLIFLVVLLLLLKIAIVAEYGEDGVSGYLKILFFKLKLPPEKKKKEKAEPVTKETPKEKKSGDLETLKSIVSPILKTLGKLLRMICINRLTLDVRIATGDACSTALLYGSACAGAGMIFPALDNNIKIKKKSVSIIADFENTESTAYMYADISLRVWQILILGIYLIFQYIRKQKGFEKNGGTRT